MKNWKTLKEAEQNLVTEVLEALAQKAGHYDSLIDDAAVEAGILWRCVCGWLNPAASVRCGAGDGCPGVRP